MIWGYFANHPRMTVSELLCGLIPPEQRESFLFRLQPCAEVRRGYWAHSCWSNFSFTFAGGSWEKVPPGLGTIQLQSAHPHAAKELFSSQSNSLAIGFVVTEEFRDGAKILVHPVDS